MTPDHPLGEVLRDGDTFGLRYERTCGTHPTACGGRSPSPINCSTGCPSTSSANVARVPRSRPRSGRRWSTKYQITDATLPGRILTWDPPRTFSWMWDRDTLIFELHPTDSGTRLVFTTWVVDTTAGVDKTAAGYHVCLDQLVELLDTDAPRPFIDRDASVYEAVYADIVSA